MNNRSSNCTHLFRNKYKFIKVFQRIGVSNLSSKKLMNNLYWYNFCSCKTSKTYKYYFLVSLRQQ